MIYLLQISVAPRFAVGEYEGCDPAVLVVLHAYGHGSPLDARHMPPRGVGHVDSIQAAAWRPQSGPAGVIVVDPEGELPVVVVDFLRTSDSIEVQ